MKSDSPQITKLTLDIDSLPDNVCANRYQFTKEQDEILLKYWKVKKQCDISEIMGISPNTLRKRYRELTKG